LLTIEKIQDWNMVASLKSEWELLSKGIQNEFYLSFPWVMNWCQCFGSGCTPFFVRVRENSSTVAILPIVISQGTLKKLPVRELTLCTNGHSILGGIIAPHQEEEIGKAVWEFLKTQKEWDLFYMTNIPKGACGYSFQNLCELCGLSSRTFTSFMYNLSFKGSWEEYWKNQSANFRSNHNKALRKLERRGELTFRVSESKQEFIDDMDILFEVDSKSWKKDGGEVMSDYAQLVNYYKGFGSAVAGCGRSFVSILSVGGNPIAAMLNIDVGGWNYGAKISCIEDSENSSPGFLLLIYSLRDAWLKGKKGFCFLSGDNVWQRFRGDKQEVVSRMVFNPSVYGRILSLVDTFTRKLNV